MAQSPNKAIRQGGENLLSTEVFCEGGLDLTQSVFADRVGCASELKNFEVSPTGGYSKILGFTKYSDTIVPGQGYILGVHVFWPGTVLAARQDASDATKYNIYHGTGTTWTQINPATTTQSGDTHTNTTLDNLTDTSALIVGQPVSGTGIQAGTTIVSVDSSTAVTLSLAATATATVTITFSNPLTHAANISLNFCDFNWTGTQRTVITDGTNHAYRWDGTTMTILISTGSPANPQFAAEFNSYLFLSGYSSNYGAVTISAPLDDNDYTALSGAAEVVIGDTINWLEVWRDNLIIFGPKAIHKITGNSTDISTSTPFTVAHITDKIGCIDGETVQEIDGDLLFLAPDGMRTISGTFKIGDTEIASVSRPIQSILAAVVSSATPLFSLVIKKKTQYRLFYSDQGISATSARGIIGGIRRYRDGHEGWEWGELTGIQVNCCDSGYLSDGEEYVIHGGLDGYVYQQESGYTYDGEKIVEDYITVPLDLGDLGLRKATHRVTIYATTNVASPTLYLNLIYNYNATGTIQPGPYTLSNIGGSTLSVYDDPAVTYDDPAIVYDLIGNPVFRKSVQGSGFTLKLQITSTNDSAGNPYTIQGFYIEYYVAGRR